MHIGWFCLVDESGVEEEIARVVSTFFEKEEDVILSSIDIAYETLTITCMCQFIEEPRGREFIEQCNSVIEKCISNPRKIHVFVGIQWARYLRKATMHVLTKENSQRTLDKSYH